MPCTAGFVLDERGFKMSKSLGNVVDPGMVIVGVRPLGCQHKDSVAIACSSTDVIAPSQVFQT